jgi:hypothetical protein
MGTTSLIERLKSEWKQYRSNSNLRFEAMQDQLEEFGSRLDKYDKPAQTQKKTTAKKDRVNAKPVPVPERPEVMEASGAGVDPR